MSAENRERRVSSEIRHWIALLTALVGLVAAVVALVRPPDTTVTQAGYEELTAGMKALSEQQRRDHEDLAVLRGYLAGQAGEGLPSAGAPPPVRGAASAYAPPSFDKILLKAKR